MRIPKKFFQGTSTYFQKNAMLRTLKPRHLVEPLLIPRIIGTNNLALFKDLFIKLILWFSLRRSWEGLMRFLVFIAIVLLCPLVAHGKDTEKEKRIICSVKDFQVSYNGDYWSDNANKVGLELKPTDDQVFS